MISPVINGNIYVKVSAATIILKMTQKCQACCKGKGFYENCVKPLKTACREGIPGVRPHNDPAFNDHYDDHFNNKDHRTGVWHVNPPPVKPEPIKPLNNKIERKPEKSRKPNGDCILPIGTGGQGWQPVKN